MVYKCFYKKTGSGEKSSVNEEVVQELHKPVIKKLIKINKSLYEIKDKILAADLAEIWSLSSKNCNVKYLLCVIHVSTKYSWIKPFKDKKGKTVLNAFIETIKESNCKSNKLWVDQGKNYNRFMQKWIDNNLMYSTHN